MITVLVADDHAFVRRELVDLLAGTEDIRVVAECVDGSEVTRAVARTRPDVVLMDLQMPRMSGLEATRALRTAYPHTRVIVLTGSLSADAARGARGLGAAGVPAQGGGGAPAEGGRPARAAGPHPCGGRGRYGVAPGCRGAEPAGDPAQPALGPD